MKKIIRGIALGVFAAIVVTVAGLAVYLFKPPVDDDVKPTFKDALGNAYLVYEDEDSGEKYAAVTDEQGNVWGREINDDGSLGETVASLEGKVSKDDIISNYSGDELNVTNDISKYTGSVSEVTSSANQASATADSEGTTATTSSGETTENNDPSTFKITKYKDIFASNNYLIEFTTNDETLGNTPIIAAAKNGNVVIDTKIDTMTCKLLYLANKDKTYILIDNFRIYCSVPESMMGDDFDLSDMNMGSSLASNIDVSKIEKSTVNIDGVSYYCESCKTKDGGEIRYYFDGDSLVRFDTDTVDENGAKTTASTYFSKITTDVPDSTFEIPSNYKYLNVGFLGSLAG